MTKSELSEALAIELNCSIGTALDIVSTILDAITETLVNCDNVEIRGFGSFTVRSWALNRSPAPSGDASYGS